MTALNFEAELEYLREGKAQSVPTFRLATVADELHLLTLFSRMLRELEKLGGDVLATDANIDLMTGLFLQAILMGEHGIILAFTGGDCVGAVFTIPDPSGLQTKDKVAVTYGLYVDPEWRRQGAATQLQELSHNHLAKLGFTKVVTTILKDNEAGFRCNMAAGANVTGYLTTINLKEAE